MGEHVPVEKRPPPTLGERVVTGGSGALFFGVMLLVWGFPVMWFTSPLYWTLVGAMFVTGFALGHWQTAKMMTSNNKVEQPKFQHGPRLAAASAARPAAQLAR